MQIQFQHQEKWFAADLSQPIDISIPIGQVKCFYAPDLQLSPYQSGDFIGAVKEGAPVNFFNVFFNPHGNGTHTESLGHVTIEQQSVNQQLKQYHFLANLISVSLETFANGDQVISAEALDNHLHEIVPKALIIRTLPNLKSKLTKNYSGTNPPYLSAEAMQLIVDKGVEHLLIDLPSVDREVDGGVLASHHLFWQTQSKTRENCTITELIFIPDDVPDGLYLLNLQIASLELDASPSKPVLYSVKEGQTINSKL